MYRSSEQKKVSEEVEKRRWLFLVHALRHEGLPQSPMKLYSEWEEARKLPRGRPAMNITVVVKEYLKKKKGMKKAMPKIGQNGEM